MFLLQAYFMKVRRAAAAMRSAPGRWLFSRLKKGTTVAQNRAAVRAAKAAGLEVRGDFLVGVPGETRAMLDATLRFAIGEKLDFAHFNRFEPFPGTELYATEFADSPELSARDWQAFGSVQDVEKLYHLPDGLTREQYTAILRGLTRGFYLRPAYIMQRLRGIKTITQLRGHVLGALGMLQL